MQQIRKKRYFGFAFSMFLLVAFCAASVPAKAAAGTVEIDVPVRGTYLYPDPQGSAGIESPGIADLQSNGISPGDEVLISFEGTVDVYGGSDYHALDYLIGVFSSTNQLLSISEAVRVPGAIDAGEDVDTGETWFSKENTDIPEDFEITPSTGFSIIVPENAKYLFVAMLDSWYSDNTSPGPLSVTVTKQGSETTGGFPLEYVLAAVVVVMVVAFVLVFLMLKRRKPSKTSNR